LKLQVVKLVLQEVDCSVTIRHSVLKLVNLAVELGDKRSPALELGTSLLKLPISQLDRQVQGLSMVHQLSDGVTLVSVEFVEAIQAHCCHPKCPDRVKGSDHIHVCHPVKPKRVCRVRCREQPERGQNHLQRAQRAKGGHR